MYHARKPEDKIKQITLIAHFALKKHVNVKTFTYRIKRSNFTLRARIKGIIKKITCLLPSFKRPNKKPAIHPKNHYYQPDPYYVISFIISLMRN
ncbi:IS1 family transposase [Pantoea eucalypti]|uniref:Transposase n=1 Tax=Pantoea eucalypti TaxID=470933 RepID=A0ABY2ZPV8_9GAMM|nr:hypothetical protein C5L22_09515 [Pantoea ananatis]QGF28862.1 hypothetical protein EE896_14355 [Pantoea eucalypti]QNQ60584.1 hypothetical protein IAI47_14295 [Pantoea sp. MT58]TPD97156.1 hypothetical protein FJP68_09215 [Pantoea vagans]TPV36753.1 hypothetical protein FJW02_11000 [Pantoea eucalypti]